VEFSTAAKAHHFHSISGEILYLINRHLNDYLDRASTADQVDRLTTLATALSELAAGVVGNAARERVLAAACRLTGATKAMLLTEEDLENQTRNTDGPRTMNSEAIRLLKDTGQGGWQSTVLETRDDDGSVRHNRSLLVVPLETNKPFPGLVLLDKRRLHPLDGSSFTEFDALFARRLLPLLALSPGGDGTPRPQPRPRTTPATASIREADFSGARGALSGILKMEMDRCDRYHTMLGLAAFRLGEDVGDPAMVAGMVAEISRKLRSSDHTACLEDGTILVIVPEDIQSLPRLQRRVTTVLRQLSGNDELTVLSSSRVYPGGGDSPEALIQSVLSALP
jgi:hypothetical protein